MTAESTAPISSHPAAAPVFEAPAKTGWLRFIPSLRRRSAADHLRQAQRFVEKQNFSQALQAYEQALEADAQCTRAHQGIAMLLTRRGGREHLQAALAHILESVRTDPYDPQNHRINALIFQRRGSMKHMQIELRCMAITHTLRRQPQHPVANNQMGVLLLRQFRMDLAAEHFQRAVQAQPRYEAALRNLARICCARAETADPQARAALLSEGSQHVQKALDAAPSSAGWTILARIRLLSGQPQEAMAAVQAAERFSTPSRDLASVRAEVRVALATIAPPHSPEASNSPSMG
jgi:Tfp pilus assembly protein PilF